MGTRITVPMKEGDFKPSATIKLSEKKGNFVTGTLKRRFESKVYPGKFSYLLDIENLEGTTTVWDKDAKIEKTVDVAVGDSVFVKGTTRLDLQMKQVQDGSNITITYLGKGTAKKGQNAPHNFDVVVN